MKKQLLNPMLILTTAVTAALFTGCASMNQARSSDANEPVNALAFTTLTEPKELVKWTGDRFMQLSLRSMDMYYFQVPDTGLTTSASVDRDVSRDLADRPMDSEFRDAAGAAPSPYQSESETRSYRIIRHQPGSAR